MPKTLEKKSVEELKEDMREEGYSPEVIKIVEEHAGTVEPGHNHPEYGTLIYIAVMPDDSGSIAGVNPLKRDNTQDVMDGHNNIVEALKELQQARFILFKTQYLNSDTPLNNWVSLDKAVRMTKDNFTPEGGTPLYDKTLSLLTSVIYEKNEALKRGHSNVRWGIILITDGDDTELTNTANKVKIILDDMRKKGEIMPSCEPDNMYAGSIALLGIEDRETDPNAGAYFEKVARSMGIEWVLHANRLSSTDMRRAFNTFSKAVAR